eukprot:TRINITY_DN16161_c0_g1_i1.p1 TRINITY_DN16161_c0_g1~~TRINITY_DN16161_c0_g1_i1.p1  ORF type:complete len:254 (+),score=32.91 TRINITY_DN16161_c0_g1_i1:72-833(+)
MYGFLLLHHTMVLWKQMYFYVDDARKKLWYARSPVDRPVEIIDLAGASIKLEAGSDRILIVQCEKKSYRLKAPTPDLCGEWFAHLKQVAQDVGFDRLPPVVRISDIVSAQEPPELETGSPLPPPLPRKSLFELVREADLELDPKSGANEGERELSHPDHDPPSPGSSPGLSPIAAPPTPPSMNASDTDFETRPPTSPVQTQESKQGAADAESSFASEICDAAPDDVVLSADATEHPEDPENREQPVRGNHDEV